MKKTVLTILSVLAIVLLFTFSSAGTDEVKIKSIVCEVGAEECTPYFSADRDKAAYLVGYDTEEVTLTVTVDNGLTLSASGGTLENSDHNGTYKLTVQTPLKDNFNQITSTLTVKNADGTVSKNYTIYFFKVGTTRGVVKGMPDKVYDYICPGSQYTSGGNTSYGIYGMFPEKTMNSTGNWNSCISLGNFGGSITYYYSDPVTDDPKNPYGIDFTVFGNANNGASFSEPGEVQVSEDGEKWYCLAGSEHYEDKTMWNYTLTYKRPSEGVICDYEDNFGNGGSLGKGFGAYRFPEPEYYPLHSFSGDSLTVCGTRLVSPSGEYGDGIENTGMAAFPKWGYADVHTNSSAAAESGEDVNLLVTPVGNPYSENYNGFGDGFDLKWAVDENGMPVDTESLEIHYIRVQTASFINGGALGEKSTEVSCVVRTDPNSSAHESDDKAVKVKIGEEEIILGSDKNVYPFSLSAPFDIRVETDSTANVYINNQRGFTRSFDKIPDKGIIRIIVQNGKASPEIYYLVSKEIPQHEHTEAMKEYITPSSCTAEGQKETIRYCDICGIVLEDTVAALPLADHVAGEEVTVTEPTCSQEGKASCTCIHCGEELSSRVLPKVDHSYDRGRCIYCGKWKVFIVIKAFFQKVIELIKKCFS